MNFKLRHSRRGRAPRPGDRAAPSLFLGVEVDTEKPTLLHGKSRHSLVERGTAIAAARRAGAEAGRVDQLRRENPIDGGFAPVSIIVFSLELKALPMTALQRARHENLRIGPVRPDGARARSERSEMGGSTSLPPPQERYRGHHDRGDFMAAASIAMAGLTRYDHQLYLMWQQDACSATRKPASNAPSAEAKSWIMLNLDGRACRSRYSAPGCPSGGSPQLVSR